MTRWFPLAPGTTLPAAPAAVAGQITATKTVPVWNETVLLTARTTTQLVVATYPYPLTALTVVNPLRTRTGLTLSNIVPSAQISTSAQPPRISTGVIIRPQPSGIGITASSPRAAGGASVAVPTGAVSVAAATPVSAGPQRTVVMAPSASTAINAPTPAVSSGAAVTPTTSSITIVAAAPSVTGTVDTSFSNVSLLLHLNGSNGSTTFTDSSSRAVSGTAYGNAQITTAQSKFGGASAVFDGNGDYVQFATDTAYDLGNTYTVEMFIRVASTSVSGGLVHRGFYTTSNNTWDGLAVSIRGLGTFIRFYFYGTLNSNEQYIDVTTSGNINANTWHHIAMVRNGTSGAVYIDGVSKGTISGLNTPTASSRPLKIGVWDYSAGSEWFNGFLDELRITKGVARYTSNFTPPASQFPDK